MLETDDSGAIYTCPRDFTSRGTVIRHNYHTVKSLYGSGRKGEDVVLPRKWLESVDPADLKKVDFKSIPFDQIGHISE